MKIALVSDTHDHLENMELLFKQLADCDVLIHCGDHCAPFVFSRFAEHDIEQHHITGNNLGDPFYSQSICEKHEHMHFYRIYAELELDSQRIAVIHYPEPAKRIAQSGEFDVVCFGHTHEASQEQIDECTLINPGAVMGNKHPAQFVIFDTQTNEFETVLLK